MSESLVELRAMAAALRGLDQDVEDAARVEQIRLLEELKAVAAAAQARVTASFVDSQRSAQSEAGVRAEPAERGVAAQVGLAKWGSPRR